MASGVAAIRRRDRQCIIIVDVAQITSHVGVPVGQRKAGRIVIEHSRSPGCNHVTGGAGRSRYREPRRDMIRYVPADRRGALESRLMASIAIRRIKRVIVIHMAGGAGRRRRRHVRSGQ